MIPYSAITFVCGSKGGLAKMALLNVGAQVRSVRSVGTDAAAVAVSTILHVEASV